jgi:hypothetical protein
MARLESLETYMEEFLEKCRGENLSPCTDTCLLHVDVGKDGDTRLAEMDLDAII